MFLAYDLLKERRTIEITITKFNSILPCVCSIIDHRERQTIVRTSVRHSTITSCATFFVLTTVTSSMIYYWANARQHGIYLLNRHAFSSILVFTLKTLLLNFYVRSVYVTSGYPPKAKLSKVVLCYCIILELLFPCSPITVEVNCTYHTAEVAAELLKHIK